MLDAVINFTGNQLVDILRDCDMLTLNGGLSQDMDNFTVFSTLGKSVVDSVVVQSNCFRKSNHFKLVTYLIHLMN